METGGNWEKPVQKIPIIDKKTGGNENKMKEKYLLSKHSTFGAQNCSLNSRVMTRLDAAPWTRFCHE